MDRTRTIGFACVFITALGWGLNWPATKMLLAECPPLSARGLAGCVAGLLLFVIARLRGESLVVPRRFWPSLIASSVLNVSVWMGCTTASLRWLPAGQAATLAYTMPIWASLLAWPVLGQRPTLRQAVSILLGCGGVALLVGGAGFDLSAERGPGIALALSAAVLFAFSTVAGKKHPLPLPRIALTAWQVAIGCVPLLVAGLLFERPDFAALPPLGWAALAYTAVISMGLCYLTWFAAVRYLPASTAAIGTLLTPAIGVAAAAVALGEPLTATQVGSLLLVLVGTVCAMRG
jgi:drug/metabolite transporter (DMT)-like permease